MAKTKSEIANIEALKVIYSHIKEPVDPRSMLALAMKECGASYREIGEVLEISKQRAETLVKKARKALK